MWVSILTAPPVNHSISSRVTCTHGVGSLGFGWDTPFDQSNSWVLLPELRRGLDYCSHYLPSNADAWTQRSQALCRSGVRSGGRGSTFVRYFYGIWVSGCARVRKRWSCPWSLGSCFEVEDSRTEDHRHSRDCWPEPRSWCKWGGSDFLMVCTN